jgi:hypothetical protein
MIGENLAAPFGLRQAVFIRGTPCLYRGLIVEERQGQDFAGLGQALEAFDGDEAVDLFEMGRSCVAISRYSFLRPGFAQTSKMTVIMFSLPRGCYEISRKASTAPPNLWRAAAA